MTVAGTPHHIPDPVAYATAVARLHEHPQVREVLDKSADPGHPPRRIRDIPVEDVLGPDGHLATQGFGLVGDDWKAALNQRRDFARAVRAELDGGATAHEAIEQVRSSAASQGLAEPQVERVDSFEGGKFEVQLRFNQALDGYEVWSFHVNPRQEPG